MATWSTAVTTVHIRLQGTITGQLDITGAGSAAATASLMFGSNLIRIGDRVAAQRLAATWRDAALNVHRLPETLPTPAPVTGVGVVAQFARDVLTRQDISPGTAAGRRPYLRIQTGPLVWSVMDRAAYWSTRKLWDLVEDQL